MKCNNELHKHGLPMPRTCAKCGLGACTEYEPFDKLPTYAECNPNTALWIRAMEMGFMDDGTPHTKSYHLGWIAGIEAAQQRLMQMHRIATERHNLYHHAALEMAKLKEQP